MCPKCRKNLVSELFREIEVYVIRSLMFIDNILMLSTALYHNKLFEYYCMMGWKCFNQSTLHTPAGGSIT